MIAKNNFKTKYVEYLVKELEIKKDYIQDIRTIYIGGGTPTSLPLNLLDYFLYHLFKYVDKNKLVEFTIEVNPKDVSVELVKLFKKYNVNRVSLGVQSFNKQKLKFLGRDHDKKTAIKAVKTFQKYGITNINLDFIYATPNDSVRKVKRDLAIAINLNVSHISTYSLILEEKTILHHLYKKGQYTPFDEDKEYKIYKNIVKYLKRYGYIHYEISNFAKKKKFSVHNLVYWTNMKYLGIGAGASYYIDNTRYTNVMNLNKYFEGIDNLNLQYAEMTELSQLEQMQEEIILGLRKIDGVNLKQFEEKFGMTLHQAFPFLDKLIEKKMLKIVKNEKLIIPKKKLYLSNVVLTEFI
jgi:oxygen-independent coproporphyrinogen-3 oxidase